MIESRSSSGAQSTLTDSKKQLIRGYVDWLPFNPELNKVAQMYLNHGLAGAICGMAPAPFCCSQALHLKWTAVKALSQPADAGQAPLTKLFSRVSFRRNPTRGNMIYFVNEGVEDDPVYFDIQSIDAEQMMKAVALQRVVYVDKHLLLHRLYVGMDMHFGTRSNLHNMLAGFLPDTYEVLKQPTSYAAVAGGEAFATSLLNSWQNSMLSSMRAAANAVGVGVPQFHTSLPYRS
jgi:hypothetical protein